jgi:hypothetical protein
MPDWLVIGAAVAGYAAKLIEEVVRGSLTSRRETIARSEERRLKRLERQVLFQRETLLGLQEALEKLGRTTASAFHNDYMAFRRTQTWQKELIPDGLDEEHRLNFAKVRLLTARIADDEIRSRVAKLVDLGTSVGSCESAAVAKRCLDEMVHVDSGLNERIGQLLRRLDAEETELINSTDRTER